jgi:hypothetical protein
LQFEALSQISPEEKAVARVLLESLIFKHVAIRFTRHAAAITKTAASAAREDHSNTCSLSP